MPPKGFDGREAAFGLRFSSGETVSMDHYSMKMEARLCGGFGDVANISASSDLNSAGRLHRFPARARLRRLRFGSRAVAVLWNFPGATIRPLRRVVTDILKCPAKIRLGTLNAISKGARGVSKFSFLALLAAPRDPAGHRRDELPGRIFLSWGPHLETAWIHFGGSLERQRYMTGPQFWI
ncbi:hypothetical protein PVAR5_0213 [Paecilomyces variotii No. 5]|uniref:Uncharacterized protein n=1 Tax=Byssochlamys spectabilis (strain No. 5 / NBRC 109023) TaxID=1356009 RepID=V5HQR5_BYSSN|nr:hypothetical protein PVAR5_0213 [Paecilomyces variotii No. 5]